MRQEHVQRCGPQIRMNTWADSYKVFQCGFFFITWFNQNQFYNFRPKIKDVDSLYLEFIICAKAKTGLADWAWLELKWLCRNHKSSAKDTSLLYSYHGQSQTVIQETVLVDHPQNHQEFHQLKVGGVGNRLSLSLSLADRL